MSRCSCLSYNRPDWGGTRPEVVVPPPPWSTRPSICLDACIADAVQMLWREGIETGGSCCGHNQEPPSVILTEGQDVERALELLRADGRDWHVGQWRIRWLAATYPIPQHGWTCFHCGETFTTVGGAEDHFGAKPNALAACQIKVGEERGPVMALRRAEARIAEIEAATPLPVVPSRAGC